MQQWSLLINDTDIIGRAYFKKKRKLLARKRQGITIFIAKIAQFVIMDAIEKKWNARKALVEFLSIELRTELHEHLHIHFANTNNNPFSERKCEFWADNILPAVAEIVASAYTYCFDELYEWFEEQISLKKCVYETKEKK